MALKLRSKVKKTRFPWSWLPTGSSLAMLLAPKAIKLLVNQALKKIPGYQGHVKSFSVDALEGSITIDGLQLDKKIAGSIEPFLTIRHLRAKIRWADFLRGRIVGIVDIFEPVLLLSVNDVQSTPAKTPPSTPRSWAKKLRALPASHINELRVVDGQVHIFDVPGHDTEISIDGIHITARNLVNREMLSLTPNALIEGDASVMSTGHLQFAAEIFPLATLPTFNVDVKLKSLDLSPFKKLLGEKTGSEFERGTLSFVAQASAGVGQIEGYIKPVFTDLVLKDIEGQKFSDAVKGKLVRGAVEFLKNRSTDDIATKVSFSGSLEDPNIGALQAIGNIIGNAFGRALHPTFESAGPSRLSRVVGMVKEALHHR